MFKHNNSNVEAVLQHAEHAVEDAMHNVGQAFDAIYEGLQEEDIIKDSCHKKRDQVFLLFRNLAVATSLLFFFLSFFNLPNENTFKSFAYFSGAAAYIFEFFLLTDCFRKQVPHNEMFMAYCFGPLYILLGIRYLLH